MATKAGMKANSSNIDIFLRVRPTPRISARAATDVHDGKVEFNIPRDLAAGYINNQRENYSFRFNGILPPDTKQDEVFERVARPVVEGAMDGINGTVFAYGQTGSGKTFTITGGPERYADRGMIPRTISHVFKQMTERADYIFTAHISYMEIYNESSYDLLDPSREIKELKDLPRVTIQEDDSGNYHMRNLSIHRAENEEEALNLLFLGDTNRMISETPMNMASSRSHCVFTLHVEARRAGEDRVRKSKLNLVDLAGSERVHKTGLDGTVLQEAKYINISLHFLEQERAMGIARTHIPYRNSMMTMVLRDSLGGNCRTVMVATVNLSQEQLDESISTCRFAQRVAMVSNVVSVNEERDPTLIIQRLKQEVRDLREEIRLLQGGEEARGPLTPDEIERLRKDVEAYVASEGPDARLQLGGSMMMVRCALEILKQMTLGGGGTSGAVLVHRGPGQPPSGPLALLSSAASMSAGGSGDGNIAAGRASDEENQKLRLQVQQRDNEINILVSMLKKRGGLTGADAGAVGASAAGGGLPRTASDSAAHTAAGPSSHAIRVSASDAVASISGEGAAQVEGGASAGASAQRSDSADLLDMSILKDRNRAFEHFRKSYRQNTAIEDNKAVLKQKYMEAKALGNQVNADKALIMDLKQQVERRRIQQSAAEIAREGREQGDGDEVVIDEVEEAAKAEIVAAKHRYKAAFDQLRAHKREIEHLQLLLEQSRKRMTKDFEQWHHVMLRPDPDAIPWPAQHNTGVASVASSVGRGAPSEIGTLGAASMDTAASRSRPVQLRHHAGYNSSTTQELGAFKAAKPLLTGDVQADKDILGFYAAREKVMQGQRVSAAGLRASHDAGVGT